MTTKLSVFTLTLLCLFLSSCATHSDANPQSADTDTQAESTASSSTACTEPRPQMCTREYRPVCATLKEENAADSSQKTYSTGCTACSDPQVQSYEQGRCKE